MDENIQEQARVRPPVNLFEYEARARTCMDAVYWDYFAGGAEDEATLRANRAAFARLWLRPRMLVDVSAIDLRTTALGAPVSMPILVAPTAYQRLAHAEGEVATARGVGAADTLMIAAALATQPLEAIAQAARGPLWFQLYVYRERAVSAALVRRAEAQGYTALVLTADAPILGRRERDMRNQFALPPELRIANFDDRDFEIMHETPEGASAIARHAEARFDQSLTWEALDWLRGVTTLPVVVKGILTAEDARLAVEHGAAGVIVSNHGGRQLDGALPTLEALPEVVAAVAASGGACEVYVDGGIRRGVDVLKALALGARAALVGRPILWGLALDGADGVHAVLELLREELRTAMMLAGRPTIASIDETLIRRAPYDAQ